jgi:hypothetical protein
MPISGRVTQKAGFTSAGPYDIENVAIESYAVYTNHPPAGALRGFGARQTAWLTSVSTWPVPKSATSRGACGTLATVKLLEKDERCRPASKAPHGGKKKRVGRNRKVTW